MNPLTLALLRVISDGTVLRYRTDDTWQVTVNGQPLPTASDPMWELHTLDVHRVIEWTTTPTFIGHAERACLTVHGARMLRAENDRVLRELLPTEVEAEWVAVPPCLGEAGAA